jgi:hypothetical protein
LNDLLDALEGAAEIETEVHKGTFGTYFDFIWLSLGFDKNAGPFRLKIDDRAVLMNYGVSYEMGRWKLGDGPRAPVVTVAPYVGGHSLIDHVKLDFQRFPSDTVKIDFHCPVVGVRTFWDLTEPWGSASRETTEALASTTRVGPGRPWPLSNTGSTSVAPEPPSWWATGPWVSS